MNEKEGELSEKKGTDRKTSENDPIDCACYEPDERKSVRFTYSADQGDLLPFGDVREVIGYKWKIVNDEPVVRLECGPDLDDRIGFVMNVRGIDSLNYWLDRDTVYALLHNAAAFSEQGAADTVKLNREDVAFCFRFDLAGNLEFFTYDWAYAFVRDK